MNNGGDNMKLTLKQARLIRELTQDQMAQKLGIHSQTYRKIELNPDEASIAQAKAISKVLGISNEEIFFDRESSLTGFFPRTG